MQYFSSCHMNIENLAHCRSRFCCSFSIQILKAFRSGSRSGNIWYGSRSGNIWHGSRSGNIWYGSRSGNIWHGSRSGNIWYGYAGLVSNVPGVLQLPLSFNFLFRCRRTWWTQAKMLRRILRVYINCISLYYLYFYSLINCMRLQAKI